MVGLGCRFCRLGGCRVCAAAPRYPRGVLVPDVVPRSRRRRLPSLLAMTALVGVLGATGMLIAARKTIDSVTRVPGVAANLSPSTASVENFLLVGSDSRAGIDPNAPDVGATGTAADVSGNRSDTIMILRRDRSTGAAALLSIPRDLWVQGAGSRRQAADQLGVQRWSRGARANPAERARPAHPSLRGDRLLRLRITGQCVGRGADLRRLRHPRREHRPQHHRTGLSHPRRRYRRWPTPAAATTRSIATTSGTRIRHPTSAARSASRSSSTWRCRRHSTGSRSIRSLPAG